MFKLTVRLPVGKSAYLVTGPCDGTDSPNALVAKIKDTKKPVLKVKYDLRRAIIGGTIKTPEHNYWSVGNPKGAFMRDVDFYTMGTNY